MKLNCDIIQDLIPSYADEICSEASKSCVEEHLQTCENCRKLVELCKNNGFSAKNIEQKQLDGLKKLKKKLNRQNLFSYILLLFMCFFGLYTFGLSALLPMTVYYVLLAVCLLGTCLCTIHGKKLQASGKPDLLLVGSSVLLSIFSLLLMYFCVVQVDAEKLLFELEPRDLGPLVSGCLSCFFLLQLVLSVGLLFRMFRKNRNNRSYLCLTLTGAFLTLTYRVLLGNMNTVEGFQMHLIQVTLVVLIMGVVVAGLCLLMGKKTSRSLL